MATEVSPWLEVLGRAHVLVVHAPLAFLPAALLFHVLRLRQAALACLWLGALSAVAAAASGWWWVEVDPKSGRLVELHRWFGVSSAALGVVALVLALVRKQGPVAPVALLVAAVVVGVTGHFGGELVHGRGFLTEPFEERAEREAVAAADADPDAGTDAEAEAEAAERESRDRRRAERAERELATRADEPSADPAGPPGRDARAARETIQRNAEAAVALLAGRCVECHGPDVAEADFRLDRLERDLEQLDQWGILIPGDPDASLLVQRVELPPDDPDFMPEEGEPLTAEEHGVLRRWIAAGAPLPDAGGE